MKIRDLGSGYQPETNNLNYRDPPRGGSGVPQFIMERVIDNGKEGFAYIPVEDIINQIQSIRERNNKNWMALLKLAFKYTPDEARIIMNDIADCDSRINELMRKLAEQGEPK